MRLYAGWYQRRFTLDLYILAMWFAIVGTSNCVKEVLKKQVYHRLGSASNVPVASRMFGLLCFENHGVRARKGLEWTAHWLIQSEMLF